VDAVPFEVGLGVVAFGGGGDSWGRNAAITELQSARLICTGEEAELLRQLANEFDLQPWSDPTGHLDLAWPGCGRDAS